MKSIFCAILASVFAMVGMETAASPTGNANQVVGAEVVLLSAKIENAIAELPESRTQESIQNAAFYVLAVQEASLEIKSAAIDKVIGHARSIGDEQVVAALNMIELQSEVKAANATVKTEPGVVASQTVSLKPPPSSQSNGGSDY